MEQQTQPSTLVTTAEVKAHFYNSKWPLNFCRERKLFYLVEKVLYKRSYSNVVKVTVNQK